MTIHIWGFKRLLQSLGTLLLVASVLFFIFQIVGGDPSQALAGKNTDLKTLQILRTQLGLDQSVAVQFKIFMEQILCWNWGTSWVNHRPVGQLIAEGFGPSFAILTASLLTSLILAYLMALWSVAKRGTWIDVVLKNGMSVLISLHFVVIVIVVQYVFAYRFHLFPVYGWAAGWASVSYAILPYGAHALGSLAPKFFTLRALLEGQVHEQYIQTALAKGCSWPRVYFIHLTRNIIPGLSALISAQLPSVLAGSVVLEIYWGIPGLGLLLLKSIQASDYPVVKAMTLLGAAFYIFTVFIGDMFTFYSLRREVPS